MGSILGGRALAPDYFTQGILMSTGFNTGFGGRSEALMGEIGQKVNMGRWEGSNQKLTEKFIKSNQLHVTNMNFGPWERSTISKGGSVNPFSNPAEGLGRGSMTSGSRMAGGIIGTALPIGMLGYFVYQGYKEDGFSGATRELGFDLAITSAIASSNALQYTNSMVSSENLTAQQKKLVTGAKLAPTDGKSFGFTTTKMGMMTMLGKSGAAVAGASVGQAVGGTPGAFAGAFLASRVPVNAWTLGGAAIAASLAAVTTKSVKVGATLLKQGHQKRAMSRRIDTAGDTAAFFTRNANTMRSRGILAMRNSHLNARSALGMEANLTHMRRNYFSPHG